MRRREFITLVSGAVALPLTAYAQKPDGVRLGVLMPFATTDPSSKLDVAALVGQLQALGWTEGRMRVTLTAVLADNRVTR
jgi:hypothetical protein